MTADQDAIEYMVQNMGLETAVPIEARDASEALYENMGFGYTDWRRQIVGKQPAGWGVSPYKLANIDVQTSDEAIEYLYENMAPSSYAAAVLATGPAMYWPLDEPSGTVANDISGNARHGTYAGPPVLNRPSLLTSGSGKAMGTILNSGENSGRNSETWMNSSSFTVMGLVNITNTTFGRGSGDAFASRYTAAGGFNWALIRDPSGFLLFQARNTSGTAYNAIDSALMSMNTVVHCTGVYDHVNNLVSIYKNGTSVGSVTSTGTLQTGTSPIQVGQYSVTPATTPDADFDEFAFWTRALSPSEIATIAAAR